MFELGEVKQIGSLFGVELPIFDFRARETLGEMKKLAIIGQATPEIQSVVTGLISGCDNDTCKISRIHSYVKKNVRFRNDPPIWIKGKAHEAEVLYRPEYMIKTIQKLGITTGDCDDSSTLLVTMFLAAGLRAGWIAVETGNFPGRLDHVYAYVYNDDLGHPQAVDVATTRTDWTGHRHIKTEVRPMTVTKFGGDFAPERKTGFFGAFDWNNFVNAVAGTLQSRPWSSTGGGYYPAGTYAPPMVSGGGSLSISPTAAIIGAVLLLAVMGSMRR